jgi:DNA-binding beta-propeller fold protein YncE
MVLLAFLAAVTVTAKIDGFTQPCGITSSPTALYADSYGNGVLSKIDPQTNRVVVQRKVASRPCGLAFGAGSVWVEDYGANSIVRVNPTTLKVQ